MTHFLAFLVVGLCAAWWVLLGVLAYREHKRRREVRELHRRFFAYVAGGQR